MKEIQKDRSMEATTKLLVLRGLVDGKVEKTKEWLRRHVARHYASLREERKEENRTYLEAVDKLARDDVLLAKEFQKAIREESR